MTAPINSFIRRSQGYLWGRDDNKKGDGDGHKPDCTLFGVGRGKLSFRSCTGLIQIVVKIIIFLPKNFPLLVGNKNLVTMVWRARRFGPFWAILGCFRCFFWFDLHFWDPPVQWRGQSRKLDKFTLSYYYNNLNSPVRYRQT